MSLKNLYHNKWLRMAFWAILYTVWVIWLGNFWFLFGLIVVFDSHITQKVKWAFWKKNYKEGQKPNVFFEWLDAIIFAVIVVTFINIFFFQAFKIPSSSMESSLYTGDHLFVSKLTYGPRVPQTILTIPFTHNVIFGKESYSSLITNKYRRLKGFRNVERGDYVVFNFPHGDTVLTNYPAEDYYAAVRHNGRKYTIANYGPIIVRPADKTDHYVKRCVAVAGDTLEIKNAKVFINGKQQTIYKGVQNTYKVKTQGRINNRNLEKLNLNISELYYDVNDSSYPAMPLTAKKLEQVRNLANVVDIQENIDVYPPNYPDTFLDIFPFNKDYTWTRDNFGPLWIPKQGVNVKLTASNIALYERIIRVYEHNDLIILDSNRFIINGKEVDNYTFKQDYYFMMGDNRHNSLDSRYWGFVPEDHIVGRPALIWLSTDRNYSFPKRIRWRRFFKFI